MTEMEVYYPNPHSNAVANAIFLFRFSTALESVENILKLEFGEDFSQKHEMKSLTVSIEGSDSSAVDTLTGIQFVSETWLIEITKESMRFICRSYHSWNLAYKQLTSFLEQIEFFDSNTIDLISLSFTDTVGFNKHKVKQSDLIKSGSVYLSPKNYSDVDKNRLWHNHSGWFEPLEPNDILNQLECKIESLNVDESVEVANSDVSATNSLNLMHKQVILGSFSLVNKEEIKNFFEYFHIENKKIVAQVFSDPLLEEIKLVV